MPSRIERLTIRWLLRITLLATVSFALFSLWKQKRQREHLQDLQAQLATGAEFVAEGNAVNGAETTEREQIAGESVKSAESDVEENFGKSNAPADVLDTRGNALVIASLRNEDSSWLEGVLPAWERFIYVADGEALEEGGEKGLKIPKNKGREGMVYLSFILDHYHSLPNITIFHHSTRYQWHNDDPIYDGIPPLTNLRLSHVHNSGYLNLRCAWTLGCPSEIVPSRGPSSPPTTETHYGPAFTHLFPNTALPPIIGVPCCAQFAVTASQIRQRPRSDYERYRTWLLETELEDYVSGRIMEYSWHMIFGKPAVHCPSAEKCYCETWGLCDLRCSERECEGRYTLPPYSTLPEGWPEKGRGEGGWP